MTFKDYLESIHTSCTISSKNNTNVHDQAMISAASGIISAQRYLLKLASYVEILVNYALIRIHVKNAPQTALEQIESLLSNKDIKPLTNADSALCEQKFNQLNHSKEFPLRENDEHVEVHADGVSMSSTSPLNSAMRY